MLKKLTGNLRCELCKKLLIGKSFMGCCDECLPKAISLQKINTLTNKCIICHSVEHDDIDNASKCEYCGLDSSLNFMLRSEELRGKVYEGEKNGADYYFCSLRCVGDWARKRV